MKHKTILQRIAFALVMGEAARIATECPHPATFKRAESLWEKQAKHGLKK